MSDAKINQLTVMVENMKNEINQLTSLVNSLQEKLDKHFHDGSGTLEQRTGARNGFTSKPLY
jgi:hypothetical protein